LGIASLAVLYAYYVWENRRRDNLSGASDEMATDQRLHSEMLNLTDQENTSFR
jgi:hypothetical protein